MAENREDEGLKEEREGEQRQSDEVAEKQELKEVTAEAKEEEGQEQEKDREVNSNKLNLHPNAAEEQQELEGNLEPTSAPGLQSLTVDPKPQQVLEMVEKKQKRKRSKRQGRPTLLLKCYLLQHVSSLRRKATALR
ncbi:hypothetical protein PBY51_020477 [Eleginops maclovinus]|uniref:Uncharacterized protein n=1 Tax=Eleginops maclovinus TaxID=56733 RepID=A0AAN7XSR7_ELEMC|nr:hypothetical protein PBY51_020477 [Eleginops maclovinus]